MQKCKPQPKKNPRNRYRVMCGKLDSLGFVICISRIDKKCFNFIVNGKIEKVFRQRQSCNNRIIKIYNNQKIE